jgi:hypothetical protein
VRERVLCSPGRELRAVLCVQERVLCSPGRESSQPRVAAGRRPDASQDIDSRPRTSWDGRANGEWCCDGVGEQGAEEVLGGIKSLDGCLAVQVCTQ